MDYKDMLAIVKKQNPELKHKEAQAKASEMFQKFKIAGAEYGGSGDFGGAGGSPSPSGTDSSFKKTAVGAVVSNDLALAEKKLRSAVIDINSLRTIGTEVIPDGHLEKHGKEGVNTLVSWENGSGRRLPMVGYFRIWI
ncbi:MAG: hypothetical protein WCT13_06195 [Patescibacteria group bacterium]|jgi:hypothetical protein